MITREGIVVSRQEGVFRTNCIDCLDRTNVVQSMLARRSLHSQLVVSTRVTLVTLWVTCQTITN
jgi:hypothetical protein